MRNGEGVRLLSVFLARLVWTSIEEIEEKAGCLEIDRGF